MVSSFDADLILRREYTAVGMAIQAGKLRVLVSTEKIRESRLTYNGRRCPKSRRQTCLSPTYL